MRGYFNLQEKMHEQKLWIDRSAPQISSKTNSMTTTECV